MSAVVSNDFKDLVKRFCAMLVNGKCDGSVRCLDAKNLSAYRAAFNACLKWIKSGKSTNPNKFMGEILKYIVAKNDVPQFNYFKTAIFGVDLPVKKEVKKTVKKGVKKGKKGGRRVNKSGGDSVEQAEGRLFREMMMCSEYPPAKRIPTLFKSKGYSDILKLEKGVIFTYGKCWDLREQIIALSKYVTINIPFKHIFPKVAEGQRFYLNTEIILQSRILGAHLDKLKKLSDLLNRVALQFQTLFDHYNKIVMKKHMECPEAPIKSESFESFDSFDDEVYSDADNCRYLDEIEEKFTIPVEPKVRGVDWSQDAVEGKSWIEINEEDGY